MPAGSKTDPPLAKAKPISASVITYLRRQTKQLKKSFCNRREEREDVRNSADTKLVGTSLNCQDFSNMMESGLATSSASSLKTLIDIDLLSLRECPGSGKDRVNFTKSQDR
ncbi:receptor-type tyrosine-protein phosphatase zeta [Grus japonensis]|uniref:Receptor-type tyrosine-protein phosphatase zeta n=1 Tax=Grus japonensis TaxID=30415 RepID=A0ABC9YGC9_GRUJA